MMKRVIIIVCLFLALGVAIAILAKWGSAAARSAPAKEASLLWLGITNVPTGSLAVFCLSNGTRTHIACVPEAFEQASAGGWMRTAPTGKAHLVIGGWIGVREELRPGEAFTFLVPPPTTNAAWRLVFMCQEESSVVDSVADVVRDVTDLRAMKSQVRQFSGRRYYASSPEVTQ